MPITLTPQERVLVPKLIPLWTAFILALISFPVVFQHRLNAEEVSWAEFLFYLCVFVIVVCMTGIKVYDLYKLGSPWSALVVSLYWNCILYVATIASTMVQLPLAVALLLAALGMAMTSAWAIMRFSVRINAVKQ